MSALVPACPIGYTTAQVEALVAERRDEFNQWMRGQTVAICDGRLYDHDKREYVKGCDEAHGLVTYPRDVDRFIAGGAVID